MSIDFINIGIPLILNETKDYYIKGGRVFNIYFKEKIETIDWDIVATQESHNYIFNELKKYAIKNKLVIIQNYNNDFNMNQYGFEGDDFFIDIKIDDKIDYDIIGPMNLKCMKIRDFFKDMLITIKERKKQSEKYIKALERKDYDVISQVEEDYNIKIDHNINLSNPVMSSVKNFLMDNLNTIKKKTNDYKNYEMLKDLLVIDVNWNDIEKYFYDITGEDEDFYSDIYGILGAIKLFYKTYYESIDVIKKYEKTVKRYNNIIKISNDSISDEYKFFLMNKCKKEKDFIEEFDCNTKKFNGFDKESSYDSLREKYSSILSLICKKK